MNDDPQFEFSTEEPPSRTVVAGFAQFGLAGLTAVDYLVDHFEFEQVGHITADQLPAITPFENGTPRHHTRLFSDDDHDLTVLVGELFVPTWAAKSFSDAILDWTETNDVEEVTVLHGVSIPHGPEDHGVYYVASDDYREHRLADTDITAMGRGFLDGTNAELMARGLESPLRTGVFVTPVHPQAPDVAAAIRLLETVETVYGFDIDTEPLEAFAAEVQGYYEELAARVSERADNEVPEDRMFM